MLYDENLLNGEQQKIEECYAQIGKQYVAAHRDDEQAEFADLLAAVKASEKRMADHRAEVLKANGLMLCPNCGEQIMDRSVFCNFCGTKVVKPEPVIEEPTVEEPAIEEPAIEEPAIEEPAIDEPAIDEPAIEEPAIDEPAIEEPAIDEPAIEEPAIDEPVIEDPVAMGDSVCPSCGAPLEPGCLFCVECGARLAEPVPAIETPAENAPVRFCTECGNLITDDEAMFCNNCGARLGGGEIFSSSTEPTVRRCPNCGFNTTDADVVFCIECGTKLI